MKKNISILASALMLLVCITSCDKQSAETKTGVGSLEVSFGFPEIDETKAYTQSTAIPTTSWNDNIKDLMILCVNSSGVVRAARNVAPPYPALQNAYTNVFTGIPSDTYTVYAVANSQQATIVSNIGASAVAWNEGSLIGQNISTALLKLVATSPVPTVGIPAGGYICYNIPAEIFVGSTSGVSVPVDGTNATQAVIQLTRAIGMMRVRIDKTQNDNNSVDFTAAKGSLQIRRATQQWSLSNGITSSPRTATNEIYVGSAFLMSDPTSGYSGTMNLTGDISAWADVRMFPGGSTTVGAEKFDVLICGEAPVGYLPLGETATLTSVQPVYWSGQVDGLVLANNILEVDCTLKSKGSLTPPPVGTYGNLDILVNLISWANISSTLVEM